MYMEAKSFRDDSDRAFGKYVRKFKPSEYDRLRESVKEVKVKVKVKEEAKVKEEVKAKVKVKEEVKVKVKEEA